jgi:hypothetical protein
LGVPVPVAVEVVRWRTASIEIVIADAEGTTGTVLPTEGGLTTIENCAVSKDVLSVLLDVLGLDGLGGDA